MKRSTSEPARRGARVRKRPNAGIDSAGLQVENRALVEAQMELEISRERYANLYDSAPVGYLTLSRAGSIREANLAAAQLLGASREHLFGRPLFGFIDKADRRKYLHYFSKLRRGTSPTGMLRTELVVAHSPEASLVFVELISMTLAAKHQDCFQCALVDITARKRAEEEFRQARDDLLVQLIDLQRLHDVSMRLVTAGKLDDVLVGVLDATLAVHNTHMGLVSLHNPRTYELSVRASHGLKPDYIKRVELSPRSSSLCALSFEERRRVVVEDIETAPEFQSYREAAHIGGFRAIHSVPLITQEGRALGTLSVHFPKPHRPSEREIQLIDLYARLAADMINAVQLREAALRELEERTAAEAALRKSEVKLSAALRAKDEFMAVLSHELRTPLNPVLLLASDASQDPELSEEVRGYFETIRKNVELQARLIDDLLDLTRISRGKLVLDLGLQDVHTILQDALEKVRPEIDRKRQRFAMDLAAERCLVLADDARLQQVFWNVLQNATKFTGTGGKITLSTSDREGRLIVKVTDTGIGMSPEETTRVFDAFCQGDHAASGLCQFGGVGLGLTIARMLVELHKGSIRAESPGLGQGTAIIVELPLAKQAALQETPGGTEPNPPHVSIETNGKRRVLLVEDHEATRETLAHLLRRRQFEVVTAGSMAEAQKFAQQEKFDFLISDIGLPDGSGYELMASLRERSGLKGVALSGYGMDEDIARSEAAGFVAHLTKPVRVQSLENALAAVAQA